MHKNVAIILFWNVILMKFSQIHTFLRTSSLYSLTKWKVAFVKLCFSFFLRWNNIFRYSVNVFKFIFFNRFSHQVMYSFLFWVERKYSSIPSMHLIDSSESVTLAGWILPMNDSTTAFLGKMAKFRMHLGTFGIYYVPSP